MGNMGDIFVAMESFCILTEVMVTQIYTHEKMT